MRALRAQAFFLIFFLAVSLTGPEPESLFLLAPRTQTHRHPHQNDWIDEEISSLRRDALSQYEDLRRSLTPCDKIKPVTLKCNPKCTRRLKVKVHFKSKGDGRLFKSSASDLRKRRSKFIIEADRRMILVEFRDPIEGTPYSPCLKLSFKNRDGALVEEYLDFYPDGTFKFEEEPLALNGSQAIQKVDYTIRVNLPGLANLLGARSRVLQYFYLQNSDDNPGDDEMDLENSGVERSL